jgi:tetratricopeptide (TPR) repeat protein
MKSDIDSKIEELEKSILTTPDLFDSYDRLLWVYLEDESLYNDPRRINHILRCIKRFPRETVCRTPFVHINSRMSPDGFAAVENEWLKLLSENPDDVKIALGSANFYCTKDLEKSIEILRSFIDKDPTQAEVWIELGRYITAPKERLRYLLEAERRGATQPNLIVWLAKSAVDAGENDIAIKYANELLETVNNLRAEHGDKLDWNEKGKSLFSKAFETTGNRSAASKIANAISVHAYHKHWGHTVLGLVALSRGKLRESIEHLRESGSVVGDHRLSSYGPSMSLAEKLCAKEQWVEVASYLRSCELFWQDERLPIWISMVDSQRLPDFNE